MARKRRKFSPEFKLDTVVEGLRGEKTVAEICRERDITESLYYKWRDTFKECALEIFVDQRAGSEPDDKDTQIAELERMVGRLTMENEILKKARTWLDTHREKNGR
jgi:transposase